MAETILQFPDRYVGTIGWSTSGRAECDQWVRAQGRVAVPAGVQLSVSPSHADCLEPLLPVALQVDALFVNKTPITGDELAPVAAFTSLTYFHASKARKLDDVGVRHLAGLFRLEHLDLYSTLVTDDALVGFAHMEKLQHLHLGATQVRAHGLAALRGLRNLSWLSLESTKVADAALTRLDGSGLAKLALFRSRVSPDGVRAFQQRYPKCTVVANLKEQADIVQQATAARLHLALLVRRAAGDLSVKAADGDAAVAAAANRSLPPGTRVEGLPSAGKPWAEVVTATWDPEELSRPPAAYMLNFLPPRSRVRVVFPDGRDVVVPWLVQRGPDRRNSSNPLRAN